jgi:hypothetical protein
VQSNLFGSNYVLSIYAIKIFALTVMLAEFSYAIKTWAQEWGIRLEYIQPGNPQQNAYVERFNRTVRYEWLSKYY